MFPFFFPGIPHSAHDNFLEILNLSLNSYRKPLCARQNLFGWVKRKGKTTLDLVRFPIPTRFGTFTRSRELDPLSMVIDAELGSAYMWARDDDRAQQEYLRSLRLYPNSSIALYGLGICYEQQGKFEEAVACYKTRLVDPKKAIATELAYVYAISGEQEQARDVLQKMIAAALPQTAYGIAQIYVGLGEPDRALEWLQKACEDREERIVMLRVDPKLDNVRSDPRFVDLLQRLKLYDD